MLPLVSVIIPAYNSKRFISETLNSVVNQTYKNLEVIVVDDGSTDGVDEVIQKFSQADRRVQYVRQANLGVSAARNHGFRHSTGNFIAFLDADDVWLPDNLRIKMAYFQKSNVGLLHSDAILIDETSQVLRGVLQGNHGDVLDAMLACEGTQIPGPSSTLIKREVLSAVGLFDETMSTSADKDLFVRIAARFTIGRVSMVTWKYRIHSHNMHKNILAMESDMISLYKKARCAKLFKTPSFRRKCFAAMYLTLAASWAGDGDNFKRALIFIWKAFRNEPSTIVNVMRRAFDRREVVKNKFLRRAQLSRSS